MKTETIKLIVKNSPSENPFGEPIGEETEIEVSGVLIGQPSTEDLTATLQLYGKRIAYVLGIPKGDTNDWTDKEVEFWGQRFRTIGYPETGIQGNIPLSWGKNVKVEAYG